MPIRNGTPGDDTYNVTDSDDQIFEAAGGGNDVVFTTVNYRLLAGSHIEHLQAVAGAVELIGNELGNVIIGAGGDDYIEGGDGVDHLRGAAGNDYLVGGEGQDYLHGEDGDDYLSGGEGHLDYLQGGNGQDYLFGGAGDDVLSGGEGNDTLIGGAGSDILQGGNGDDLYIVNSRGDLIQEGGGAGEGFDIVLAQSSYVLPSFPPIEVLRTDPAFSNAPINLTGNGHSQSIIGNDAANHISGGILNGGIDTLTGGGGTDVFIFAATFVSTNFATITDFTVGLDRIRLSAGVFTAIAPGPLAPGAFVAGTAAGDADDRIIYNSANGDLLYDSDGNGSAAAMLFGRVTPGTGLSAASISVNRSPSPVADSAAINPGLPGVTVTGNVLANDSDADGDSLSVTSFARFSDVAAPGNTRTGFFGSFTVAENGSYTYTLGNGAKALREGQTGEDRFEYTITDDAAGSATTSIFFYITGVNDAPDAVDDLVTVNEAVAANGITGSVLNNDTDPDQFSGAPTVKEVNGIAVVSGASTVVQGTYGTLSIDVGGGWSYRLTNRAALEEGQVGEEVFTYKIADTAGASDTAALRITVNGGSSPEVRSGSEFLVNTIVAGDQVAPSVTALTNGGFVVVWQSAENGGDIKAQVYSANGQMTGGEFRIGAVPGAQTAPSVAALDTGGFVVVWNSDGDVKAQTFDIGGSARGAEFTVDLPAYANTSGDFLAPDTPEVADLAGAGFVVAWSVENRSPISSPGAPAGSYNVNNHVVRAQIVEDSGLARGAVLNITDPYPFATKLDVAGLTSGSFVVTFGRVLNASNGQAATFAQIRDAAGALVRGTFNTGRGFDSVIDADGSGGFAITAPTSVRSSAPSIIEIGHYDQLGTLLNSGASVVTGMRPSVASGARGSLSTFTRDGEIAAQLFGRNGVPIGDWFQVNTITSGLQSASDVTFLNDGRVVVVWQDAGGSDGSGSGIKAQVLFLGQVVGTAGNDVLVGSGLGEEISGREGDDQLQGRGGADFLDGGAGRDLMLGGLGNDVLLGGTEDDGLYGQEGDDELQGQGGNDFLDGGIGRDLLLGGAGGDVLVGGAGNDGLFGQDGDDQLQGDDGDDFLDGGLGRDLMLGGAGADVLVGGGDNDGVYGQDGNDELQGQDGDDFLDGGLGRDLLVGGAGTDVLVGGGDDDGLYGQDGNDELQGQDGSDFLDGGLGRDLLFGGAGQDVLAGGGDNDGLYGQDGNDELLGQDGNDFLDGAAGRDLLLGATGNDVLTGGADNDGVYGQEGDDELYGDDGDDFIDGGIGRDLLYGGLGVDVLVGGADGDLLFGQGGNDELYGEGGDDQLFGAEGDDLVRGGDGNDYVETGSGRDLALGAAGNDVLLGGGDGDGLYGEAGDDELQGGDGDDFLDGGVGRDLLLGGGGGDVLVGGGDNDGLFGQDGNDELQGQDGEDFLDGGLGRDLVVGGAGADVLVGGGDNDGLFGQDGNDELQGQDGDDFLDGGTGRDLLVGGAGTDVMVGGGDNDVVVGNEGNDELHGQDGDDYLDGGLGRDLLLGGLGADLLVGGDEDDGLYGQDGNDELNGQEGSDFLDGGAGSDVLYAGGGNDTLLGGAGADSLFGGAGADVFVIANVSENAADIDRMVDFSSDQGDRIDLSQIDANVLAGGVQGFTFVGTAAFSNKAGELRYQVQDGVATAFADINGDGAADLTFQVHTPSLAASDFFGIAP